MSTILAFSGSNSSTSINFQLLNYVVSHIKNIPVELLDLRSQAVNVPVYSEDIEKESGFPETIKSLHQYIQNAKGIIIAVNEHNSYPSAYFKNLLDWLSRLDRKCFDEKKIFLIGTSPGGRGAKGALETIEKMLPRLGAEIISVFSLPVFRENFDRDKQTIINLELNEEVRKKRDEFVSLFL